MSAPTYFAIIGTSRAAYGGVRWTLTPYNSEADIISFAWNECARTGESLESIAGIGSKTINEGTDDEQIVNEREFNEGEEFQAALAKLNDDGRTYSIYNDADPDQVKDFIEEAERIGLGERARELVEKFS